MINAHLAFNYTHTFKLSGVLNTTLCDKVLSDLSVVFSGYSSFPDSRPSNNKLKI